MRFSKTLLCSLCVLLLTVPSIAQQPSDCLQRTLLVGVANDQGSVPRDLVSENFRVAYRGRPVSPLRIAYTEGPRRVVVLLDMSGSMSVSAGKWQVARTAAWELVSALPPGSKASLMTFSRKTEIRTAMSLDRKPILDWLNGESVRRKESAEGHTALYAAIQSAVGQLQPAEPGDAIYVVTDGGENASHLGKSEIVDTLISSGIRLFALLVPHGYFLTAEERQGIDELPSVTEYSGGFSKDLQTAEAAPSPDHMNETIRRDSQQFAQEIAAYYAVTLQLSENPDKPQHLEVALVDGQGHKRKDLAVAYPHKVPACAVDSARH
jgi:hypothetical protein